MIVYPTTNYNSWISEDDAEDYFENHLNASSWDALSEYEPTMITAFRSLQELSFNIVFADDKTISSSVYTEDEIDDILQDLQFAQCEQMLHELDNDLYGQQIDFLSLSGLTVKMPSNSKTERFSQKAMAILRPYIQSPVVQRFR
jgi:hypothetical protein